MSEFRAAIRHRTLRTGIIEFNAGGKNVTSVPCTIRNVSGTGARLELNSSLWCPNQLTLIWSNGLRKSCRVAWRKRRLVGVAFADGPATSDQRAAMTTEEEQVRHGMQIGARVRKAREDRGYTEVQLAQLIGSSCDFVSLAERGEASIPLYQLMHIADLLLVSLDWLVAGPTPGSVSGEDTKRKAAASSLLLIE